MTEEDKSEILQKIKKEILDTRKKIKKYSELSKPISPENSIGRITRMDAINNKSVVEAALRESKNKLDELKYVARKINDDDFGFCIKCKSTIAIERILFRPQSKYCINCAK